MSIKLKEYLWYLFLCIIADGLIHALWSHQAGLSIFLGVGLVVCLLVEIVTTYHEGIAEGRRRERLPRPPTE